MMNPHNNPTPSSTSQQPPIPSEDEVVEPLVKSRLRNRRARHELVNWYLGPHFDDVQKQLKELERQRVADGLPPNNPMADPKQSKPSNGKRKVFKKKVNRTPWTLEENLGILTAVNAYHGRRDWANVRKILIDKEFVADWRPEDWLSPQSLNTQYEKLLLEYGTKYSALSPYDNISKRAERYLRDQYAETLRMELIQDELHRKELEEEIALLESGTVDHLLDKWEVDVFAELHDMMSEEEVDAEDDDEEGQLPEISQPILNEILAQPITTTMVASAPITQNQGMSSNGFKVESTTTTIESVYKTEEPVLPTLKEAVQHIKIEKESESETPAAKVSIVPSIPTIPIVASTEAGVGVVTGDESHSTNTAVVSDSMEFEESPTPKEVKAANEEQIIQNVEDLATTPPTIVEKSEESPIIHQVPKSLSDFDVGQGVPMDMMEENADGDDRVVFVVPPLSESTDILPTLGQMTEIHIPMEVDDVVLDKDKEEGLVQAEPIEEKSDFKTPKKIVTISSGGGILFKSPDGKTTKQEEQEVEVIVKQEPLLEPDLSQESKKVEDKTMADESGKGLVVASSEPTTTTQPVPSTSSLKMKKEESTKLVKEHVTERTKAKEDVSVVPEPAKTTTTVTEEPPPPIETTKKLKSRKTEVSTPLPVVKEEKISTPSTSTSTTKTLQGVKSEKSTTTPTTTKADVDHHKVFKKAILVLHSRIGGHKNASLFQKPIKGDNAPGYFKMILQPLDLTSIKRKIESCEINTLGSYECFLAKMFLNSCFFNANNDDFVKLTREMASDVWILIDDFKNTQQILLEQTSSGGVSESSNTPASSVPSRRTRGRNSLSAAALSTSSPM